MFTNIWLSSRGLKTYLSYVSFVSPMIYLSNFSMIVRISYLSSAISLPGPAGANSSPLYSVLPRLLLQGAVPCPLFVTPCPFEKAEMTPCPGGKYQSRMDFRSVLPFLLPTHSVDCAVHILLSHSQSFSCAGPALWNSLPETMRLADSLNTFKSQLKTHYFKLAYNL